MKFLCRNLSVALFERIRVITLVSKLSKEFAVGIGQKFVFIEGKRNGVLFYPSSLALYLVMAVLARSHLHFLHVVAELVIRHDERVVLPGVLDTVGVIVVLCGCLDHGARLGELV